MNHDLRRPNFHIFDELYGKAGHIELIGSKIHGLVRGFYTYEKAAASSFAIGNSAGKYLTFSR